MPGRGADPCVRRLRRVCAELPEVEERPGGEHGRHIEFVVRGKTFAYLTDDHHGDGHLALTVKAPSGEQDALVSSDPVRYFVPSYLGHRGWVGFRLDVGAVDCGEAGRLAVESYCLNALEKLANAVAR